MKRHRDTGGSTDHAQRVLGALYKDRDGGDLTICAQKALQCGTFAVHACVLSTASPMIKALLCSGMRESGTRTVTLEMCPGVLEQCIQYAYLGSLHIADDVACIALLQGSQYLQIQGMERACCDWLVQNVTPETCLGLWHPLRMLLSPRTTEALGFVAFTIGDNMHKLMPSLASMGADDLRALADSDFLGADEAGLVNLLSAWHTANPVPDEYGMLLTAVRFDFLSAEFKTKAAALDPHFRAALEASVPQQARRRRFALQGTTVVFPTGVQPDRAVTIFGPDGAVVDIGPLSTTEHTAAPLGPTFCAIGGIGPNDEIVCDFRIWDRYRRKWTAGPDVLIPLCYATAVTDPVSGGFYLLGGRVPIAGHGSMYAHQTCAALHFDGTAWRRIPPMQTPLSSPVAAFIDGRLYVTGGDEFSSAAEAYDPIARSWESMPDRSIRRRACAGAAVRGKLYVVGGITHEGHFVATVEVFDPKLGTWETIAPMTDPRAWCTASCVNGKLCVAGGKCVYTTGINETSETLDPDTGVWTKEPLPARGLFTMISIE
jgi:hypothetical protein